MAAFAIALDDPRRDDVRALLARHLAFCHAESPPEHVFALDLEGLLDPAVSFFSLRDADGTLLCVGALKEMGSSHAEIKSMHTAAEARGRGAGRAMVDHLLALARSRGISRVSLETGSQNSFAPARKLYERAGFAYCGPFGDYPDSEHSMFMTIELDRGIAAQRTT